MFSKAQKSSGQGTIEYLLIIAIITVVALTVASILSVFLEPTEGISTNTNQISQLANPISINETASGTNGKGVFVLTNKLTDSVTLTKINVGGTDFNYNTPLFQEEKKHSAHQQWEVHVVVLATKAQPSFAKSQYTQPTNTEYKNNTQPPKT